MFLTSSSIYAQNCKLSDVNFSDLDSNQVNVLISVGAQCNTDSNTVVLPVFNSNDMVSLCKEKWSKGAVLDQTMFDYCMKQKSDGFQDLIYVLKNSNDIPGLVDILQYAINKWYERDGWDMVLYEVNVQKDGYLDVRYLMSNGSSQKLLQNCKGKWLSNAEPQWDMVIYCLEY